jgi:hypothetical protein
MFATDPGFAVTDGGLGARKLWQRSYIPIARRECAQLNSPGFAQHRRIAELDL